MPCRATVNISQQQLIDKLLGNASVDMMMTQQGSKLCFPRLFDGLIGETGIPKKLVSQSVLSARQPREVRKEGFMSVLVSDSE